MTNEDIIYALSNNAFSLKSHVTNVDMSVLFTGLLAYIDRAKFRKNGICAVSCLEDRKVFLDATKTVLEAVPEFQRDNDKWTPEMQSTFVLNCLKGAKSAPIVLYSTDSEISNCKLLDGLQRLTAFAEFLSWQTLSFDVNGATVSSQDMLSACQNLPRFLYESPFEVRIMKFKTELEAVDYYIEINENFTHSKEDIERAKAYRNLLLNKVV